MHSHSQQSQQSGPSAAHPSAVAHKEKFTTPASLVVDAALVIAFFAFMFSVVSTHVQSENPVFVALWGGGAAACLSTVFWLAIQMFRVVLRAQRASKK